MRSAGRDIAELFGFQPDDTRRGAVDGYETQRCPFSEGTCTKTNHDGSVVYGVCSVREGSGKSSRDIVICPTRLYAEKHAALRQVASLVWGKSATLVISGDLASLRARARAIEFPVVAFGHGSGREIALRAHGGMSLDWVLQSYRRQRGELVPDSFVGVEVQSIDTTGNYRECHESYAKQKRRVAVRHVVASSHGLNFANVHKRLIPQIIRKGNIFSHVERCKGFAFVVPEEVYERFDETLSHPSETGGFSRESVSVLPCALGAEKKFGEIRDLKLLPVRHFLLDDIKRAFSHDTEGDAPRQLDEVLRTIL